MKHIFALGVVVIVALGTVVATVAVGASVKEPTVVANPYEAGLRNAADKAKRLDVAAAPAAAASPTSIPANEVACDFEKAPCAVAAGPWIVKLVLSPRPLKAMADLAAEVEVTRVGAPVDGLDVELDLEMKGMKMAPNQRLLKGAGKGRYTGKVVIVRCPSGRKDWLATVTAVVPKGAPVAARFAFDVAK
jgi:hypothetical protein